MNKKAIAILGAIFLLIVGTLGFLIYTKYGKNTEVKDTSEKTSTTTPVSTNTGDNNDSISTSTPPSEGGNKPVLLTSDLVVSPVLFFKGQAVAFFDKQGNLMNADLQTNGNAMLLTNQRNRGIVAKPNISRILWPAPKNNQVTDNFIAEFTVGGRKSWSFYDAKKGEYIDLPPQIISVDWLPGGEQIMYVWLDEKNKATLNIGSPDNTTWKLIDALDETDDAVVISPDGQNVAFFRQFNSDAVNKINYVSTDGQIWKSLVKEGYNYGVLWSPDSQKFLYAQKEKSTQKFQLWFYDILKGEGKSLGLFSVVGKAAWSKDSATVFAAVPNNGTAGETLTTDDIYKINLDTFEKKKIALDGSSVDAQDLFLTLDENKLLFRNAQDGGLYYLDVSK